MHGEGYFAILLVLLINQRSVMSRMYRTNGTKVVIDCPSSTLHGKSGIILEKDFVLGRKCFAVELDDGIYMINCDYVNVA